MHMKHYRFRIHFLFSTLVIAILGACAAEQQQTTADAKTEPPTISYTGSPFAFTNGVAITAINATLGGGAVTSCTVSPALPAGLTLGATTCAISGTPTAPQAATNHSIQASNAGGSASVSINITVVNPPAPTISYTGSPFTYVKGTAITQLSPTLGGGAVASCTVSPALPAGLSLNGTTCAVSGTPTAVQAATSHTVTATNAGGSANAAINVTVNPVAPAISYSGSPFILVMGQAMTALTPTLNLDGGAVTACSASPALPAGMNVNGTSCVISGTPTVSANATNHTVTVTTAGGTGTATINVLTGKRIFVTATAYTGNLGGISGADAKCTSDANKPTTGTYKAYLSEGTNRIACSVNWCSDSSQMVDWPMVPQRNYIRSDRSKLIGKSFDNGVLDFFGGNSIDDTAHAVWVGLYLSYTSNSSPASCQAWTSASAGQSGYIGDASSANTAHRNNGPSTCDVARRLYCVEQ
jgi:hypothetical protein